MKVKVTIWNCAGKMVCLVVVSVTKDGDLDSVSVPEYGIQPTLLSHIHHQQLHKHALYYHQLPPTPPSPTPLVFTTSIFLPTSHQSSKGVLPTNGWVGRLWHYMALGESCSDWTKFGRKTQKENSKFLGLNPSNIVSLDYFGFSERDSSDRGIGVSLIIS